MGLDSAQFWARLHERGVEYILLTAVHVTEPRIVPRLEERCHGGLRLMATFAPSAYMFQILPVPDTSLATVALAPTSQRTGTACAALKMFREHDRFDH